MNRLNAKSVGFFYTKKKGYRIPRDERCPENLYDLMTKLWAENPDDRPSFAQVSETLRTMLGKDEGDSRSSYEKEVKKKTKFGFIRILNAYLARSLPLITMVAHLP